MFSSSYIRYSMKKDKIATDMNHVLRSPASSCQNIEDF